MGGVRRERNHITNLLSLAGRPMKLSGAQTPLWQLIAWKEAARCIFVTGGDLVVMRKVWERKVRTNRHRRRNATQPWSAYWGSETQVKRRWFSSKLCWQSRIWGLIDGKRCATMATAAHQETRRFTRGLGKPGTAAELRQSVSEVVRTSVLFVSTRLTFLFSALSPPPV